MTDLFRLGSRRRHVCQFLEVLVCLLGQLVAVMLNLMSVWHRH